MDYQESRKRRRRAVLSHVIAAATTEVIDDLVKEDEKFYVRHDLDLSELADEEFKTYFRFHNFDDLQYVCGVLGVPQIECDNGTVASPEFAMAVVLRRLAFPNRWVDSMRILGRDASQLSRIYNTTLNFLYEKHGHLVESVSQPWLNRSYMEEYARVTKLACEGRYENCIGFLDGTHRDICRPPDEIQRMFYSGHTRTHCVKFQSWVIPSGLIANLHGPEPGSTHDSTMLGRSGLRDKIRELNQSLGTEFHLYADKGYAQSPEIMVPYKGRNLAPPQLALNRIMTDVRMSVEYGFLKVSQHFAYTSYSRNQHLMWQQNSKAYKISTVLANCHTCLYGFQLIKNIFGMDAPSLEFYITGEK